MTHEWVTVDLLAQNKSSSSPFWPTRLECGAKPGHARPQTSDFTRTSTKGVQPRRCSGHVYVWRTLTDLALILRPLTSGADALSVERWRNPSTVEWLAPLKGVLGGTRRQWLTAWDETGGDSEHEQWRGQLFITDETKDLIHRVLKRWTPEALKYFKTNKQTNKHGQMSDLVWSSWAAVVKLWVNTFQRGRIQPAWAKTAFPNGKLFTSPERQFQCDRSYNVDYVFIICIVP